MHLLFVKHSLAWPRSTGHDVYTFHMMKALVEQGARVSLMTVDPPRPEALRGLQLERCDLLDDAGAIETSEPLPLSGLQERFRSFYGVEKTRLRRFRQVSQEVSPDVAVAVGLDGLPYLASVSSAVRVWYLADEWVRHHLTQFSVGVPSTWSNLTDALIKGVYERVYRRCVDRAWVVTAAERRAMLWVAGVGVADVIPYGVDAQFFSPVEADEIPRSAVFWGRLDFGPNIQALQWFSKHVWPAVRRQAPDARFTIIGFHPSAQVQALATQDGISLLPDLADLRPEACRHALALFPFVSGGGIKNKLLEAASLGRAIVCTPKALGGLRSDASLPLVSTADPATWVREIIRLWSDNVQRRRLGNAARSWVLQHHTWSAAAREAIRALSTEQRLRAA